MVFLRIDYFFVVQQIMLVNDISYACVSLNYKRVSHTNRTVSVQRYVNFKLLYNIREEKLERDNMAYVIRHLFLYFLMFVDVLYLHCFVICYKGCVEFS